MTGFPVFSLQVNESWSCHWKKNKTKKKAVIQPLHPAARIWPQFQLLQNILLIIAFYISFPLILIHSQTETRSCKLRTVRNNKRPSASGGAGRKNWIFNYFIFLWRQSFIWRPQYGVDKKKKKKRQDISTQLARPKAAYFFEHLLCCLRVLSQAQLFWLWLQNAISWGGTELNGAGELNVPREAVGTQPICESETLFVIASLCQDRGCTCQII